MLRIGQIGALVNGARRMLASVPKEQVKPLVESSRVVLFMKGHPKEPMCGFSNLAVQILKLQGVAYNAFNVLEDERMRQGVKEYSDWPTIPQLFVDGTFVGGADILLEMHKNGQLKALFQKKGIIEPAAAANDGGT